MAFEKKALILGATGGAGFETAHALARSGWQIRVLVRASSGASADVLPADWEKVRGDAMERRDVLAAAEGCSLIFHGVNPAGYKGWPKLVPVMLENTIAAARETGARVVLPGTLYNFGPDAPFLLDEDTRQHPEGRKGKIRVGMEKRLRQASLEDGVKVLILRAGDFFGPHVGNSWFSQVMVKPGRQVRRITDPGKVGVGHAWAYLPDFAETVAQLIAREAELADFEVFHLQGHWFDDGRDMARMIRTVIGAPELAIKGFPWWAIRLGSPFVRFFGEVMEVAYLWQRSVRLDNHKLVGFLGHEPRTELSKAVRATLVGLGCLE